MVKRYIWPFLFFAILGFVSTLIMFVAIYNVMIVPTVMDKLVDIAVTILVALCAYYCFKKTHDFFRKMRDRRGDPEEFSDPTEFSESEASGNYEVTKEPQE